MRMVTMMRGQKEDQTKKKGKATTRVDV